MVFQSPWIFSNCSFTHLLGLILIKNIGQSKSLFFSTSSTQLLSYALIGDIFQWPLPFQQLFHISLGPYTATTIDLFQQPFHTFFGYYICTNQGHISMHVNLLQQFLHASLGSLTTIIIYLFQELLHTSVRSYTDQEHLSMAMDLFQQP